MQRKTTSRRPPRRRKPAPRSCPPSLDARADLAQGVRCRPQRWLVGALPVPTAAGSSAGTERESASGLGPSAGEVVANLFRREVLDSHRQAWLGTRPADPSGPAVGRDGFRFGRRRPGRRLSLDRRVHAQGARHRLPGARPRRHPAGRAAGRDRRREPRPRGPAGARRATCCSCWRSARPASRGDTQTAVQPSLTRRASAACAAAARQQSELEAARLAALDRRIDGDAARARPAGAESRRCSASALALAAGGAGAVRVVARRELRLRRAGAHQGRGACSACKAQLQRARAPARGAAARDRRARRRERRELPLRARARAGRDRARPGRCWRSSRPRTRPGSGSSCARRRTASSPRVLAEPGQSVTPAPALASLIPADTRLQAQLFAPSSAIGFVRPDQTVLLRYQAFPYQKFGHQRGPGRAGLARAAAARRAGRPAAWPAAMAVGRAALPHHRRARPAGRRRLRRRRSRWRRACSSRPTSCSTGAA